MNEKLNFLKDPELRERFIALLFGASALLGSFLACGGEYVEPGSHDYEGTYCDTTGYCLDPKPQFFNSFDSGCPATYNDVPLTKCEVLR